MYLQKRGCFVFISLLCLILMFIYGDPTREWSLRGSDKRSRMTSTRSLAEISTSGEALNIFLIFICIICAGLASGLTQASGITT